MERWQDLQKQEANESNGVEVGMLQKEHFANAKAVTKGFVL